MGYFEFQSITDAGSAMLARATAGDGEIIFTSMHTGDGEYSMYDISRITSCSSLKSEKQVFAINEISSKNGDTRVRSIISNQGLAQGYYIREVGLYARMGDGGEILFSISVCDEAPTFLPAMGDIPIEMPVTNHIAYSGDGKFTIEYRSDVYATLDMLKDLSDEVDELDKKKATQEDLDQLAGVVEGKATQKALDSLKDEVNGIEIGGTNLIVMHDMRQGSILSYDKEYNVTTPSNSDARLWTYANSEHFVPVSAGEYMLTYYVSAPTKSQQGVQLRMDDNTTPAFTTLDNAINSTFSASGRKRIRITITRDGTLGILTKSFEGKYKIKLEKGTMGTDWSPAPEDVRKDISDSAAEMKEDGSIPTDWLGQGDFTNLVTVNPYNLKTMLPESIFGGTARNGDLSPGGSLAVTHTDGNSQYIPLCSYRPVQFKPGDWLYFSGTVGNYTDTRQEVWLSIYFYDGNKKYIRNSSPGNGFVDARSWKTLAGSLELTADILDGAHYYLVTVVTPGKGINVAVADACVVKKAAYSAHADTADTAEAGIVRRLTADANYSPGGNRFDIKEFSSSSTNTPGGDWYHILTSQGDDPNYEVQLALGMTTKNIMFRRKSGGEWLDWVPLITGSNMNSYIPYGLSDLGIKKTYHGTCTDKTFRSLSANPVLESDCLLKVLRNNINSHTEVPWMLGDFSSGIAFGCCDTRGAVSMKYDAPLVRLAGGNMDEKNLWWYDLKGKRGEVYDLENFPISKVSGLRAELNNRVPQTVARSPGTVGKNGYVLFARITIRGQYCNQPIEFKLAARGRMPCTVCIRFANSAGTDPDLNIFEYFGASNYTLAAVKEKAGVWAFYAQKSEAYDTVTVMGTYNPYFGETNGTDPVIEYPDGFSESLPSGGTGAVPGYKTGMADYLVDRTNGKKVAMNYGAAGLSSADWFAAFNPAGDEVRAISPRNAGNAIINGLTEGTDAPKDSDYYVCQYAGGGNATKTYHRRPMSAMWNWIKGKAEKVFAPYIHEHNQYVKGSEVDCLTPAAISVNRFLATNGYHYASNHCEIPRNPLGDLPDVVEVTVFAYGNCAAPGRSTAFLKVETGKSADFEMTIPSHNMKFTLTVSVINESAVGSSIAQASVNSYAGYLLSSKIIIKARSYYTDSAGLLQ